jgi:pyruvate kinase
LSDFFLKLLTPNEIHNISEFIKKNKSSFEKYISKINSDYGIDIIHKYLGISDNIEIAKGKYALPNGWKDVWYKIKRHLWQTKR